MSEEGAGVFEELLGFRAATKKYRAAHLMNDLAQAVSGVVPADGGDLLCRVIRQDAEGEQNGEAELRADAVLGHAFERAYPRELGARRIRALRAAAGMILNFDRTVYAPGDRMASPLATHQGLLGAEGFRRFRVGPYVARILTPEGRERLRELFVSVRDPLTRALRPLLSGEFEPARTAEGPAPEPVGFDHALGARLSRLLAQPLSKPALLRAFALGASLGIVLKILGLGSPDGRPILPAVPTDDEDSEASRWEAAIQAFQRARDTMDARVAQALEGHARTAGLLGRARPTGAAVEVVGSGPAALRALVQAVRDEGEQTGIWWPDAFAIHLGRQSGCILPKSDRAGWATYRLALTPELVEVVILMSVDPAGRPQPWARMWRGVADDLGLLIGANTAVDAEALRAAQVPHVSPQRLRENAAAHLRAALRRGAARALPDGGAEAVGTLA
jgi:hypothetical protein